MRGLSSAVMVLLALLGGVLAQGQAAPAPKPVAGPAQAASAPGAAGTMQPFTSNEGQFSIDFPGTPRQASKPLTLQGGGASTLHQFWVELDNDDITYMVIYNDYPADYAGASPQELLETLRDGIVRDKTLTSNVPIDLYGVPGLAFTAVDKSGWQYAVHQYLDGTRFYQLIIVEDKGHPASMAEQFMNSFRILKGPAGNTPPAPAADQPPAG